LGATDDLGRLLQDSRLIRNRASRSGKSVVRKNHINNVTLNSPGLGRDHTRPSTAKVSKLSGDGELAVGSGKGSKDVYSVTTESLAALLKSGKKRKGAGEQ
ncbi:MAG: hypothetical protein ABI081_02355, partial [Burkholderiaceae bacterium]